jgi:hypothetical protein
MGRFERGAVEGLSARDLLARVVRCRQQSEAAGRTAAVLAGVLREARRVDVELERGGSPGTGRPILLDDVVVHARGAGETSNEQDDYSILVSESYRGGA